MSDIMHFVNDTQSKVQSAISWGQLGATLALLGEKSLAKEILNRAKESLNAPYSYSNYGGKLRDKAALIVLLSEAKFQKDSRDLLIDLALNLQKQRYLSTQELSQILRANKAVAINLGGSCWSGLEVLPWKLLTPGGWPIRGDESLGALD